jgi:hypothetical protein
MIAALDLATGLAAFRSIMAEKGVVCDGAGHGGGQRLHLRTVQRPATYAVELHVGLINASQHHPHLPQAMQTACPAEFGRVLLFVCLPAPGQLREIGPAEGADGVLARLRIVHQRHDGARNWFP